MEPADDPAVDDELGIGAEEVEIRPRLPQFGQSLEPGRRIDVVGVKGDDEIAAGGAEQGVAGGGHTAMLLADQGDGLPVLGEGSGEIVRRAVVADDDLPRRVGLCPHGGDRLADRRRGLIRRDDD